MAGFGSCNCLHFCSCCHNTLANKDDINVRAWVPRTLDTHYKDAQGWRDARTLKEQESIFNAAGVRWSELMRLPYWHHRRVAVDGMHNLFLGLLQHHFRDVLGVDLPAGEQDTASADPRDINRAEHILANSPTHSALKRIPVVALKALCGAKGLLGVDSEKAKKKNFIAMLLVR